MNIFKVNDWVLDDEDTLFQVLEIEQRDLRDIEEVFE